MNKKVISFTLATAMLLTTSLTAFAVSEKEKKMEKNEVIVIESSSTETIQGVDGIDSNSKTSEGEVATMSSSMDYDSVAVYTGAGFDIDYDNWWVPWDSDKIRSYGKTTLTNLEPLDDVKTWDLYIRGDMYKNGHYYNGIPSTRQNDTKYLKVNSPYDYSASKGDSYGVNTFHKVYDYYGIEIFNRSMDKYTTF